MNPCAVCLAVNDSGGGGNRKSRSRRAIRTIMRMILSDARLDGKVRADPRTPFFKK